MGLSLELQRQERVGKHRRLDQGLTRLEATGPQLVAVRPVVPPALRQKAAGSHLVAVRRVVPLEARSCGSILAHFQFATGSIRLGGVDVTCSI